MRTSKAGKAGRRRKGNSLKKTRLGPEEDAVKSKAALTNKGPIPRDVQPARCSGCPMTYEVSGVSWLINLSEGLPKSNFCLLRADQVPETSENPHTEEGEADPGLAQVLLTDVGGDGGEPDLSTCHINALCTDHCAP